MMAVVGFRSCLGRSWYRRRPFSGLTSSSSGDEGKRALLLRQNVADLADEIIRLRMMKDTRRVLDNMKKCGRPRPTIADSPVLREWGPKTLDPKPLFHTDGLLVPLGLPLFKYAVLLYGREESSALLILEDDIKSALMDAALLLLEGSGFPKVRTLSPRGKFPKEPSLFRVIGEGASFTIPRPVQPFRAYPSDELICPSQLPIRYAELSSQFCLDAFMDLGGASHGSPAMLTNSQTKKLEQVCVSQPNGDESSEMFRVMLKNCEKFYHALRIPYRVIDEGSESLVARDKNYILEGWFPASQTYRRLASCVRYTNCRLFETQSGKRRVEHGGKSVHLLRSTIMVTQDTISALLENNQREDGVEIPEVVGLFMRTRKNFLPFWFRKKRNSSA